MEYDILWGTYPHEVSKGLAEKTKEGWHVHSFQVVPDSSVKDMVHYHVLIERNTYWQQRWDSRYQDIG